MRLSLKFFLLSILNLCESSLNQHKSKAKISRIHFEEEILFKNVRQITFGSGQNTRSSFSKDGKYITYDGSGSLKYGTKCAQLYQLDLQSPDRRAFRLSSGLGTCRASSFFPNSKGLVYSDSFRHPLNSFYDSKSSLVCQISKCKSNALHNDAVLKDICKNSSALYELNPYLDIFRINSWGNFQAQLTTQEGYDSEAKISPDGLSILFTSVVSGQPQLWTMSALDGSGKKQLTSSLGFKGDASFSPDGSKIVFHAILPKTVEDVQQFYTLLNYNLIELSKAEVFVMNVDGSDLRQVTDLQALSWTPQFLDNHKIIFSSDFNSTNRKENSHLYTIDLDGSGLQQITFNENGRDLFPTIDYSQPRLMWSSTRNSSKSSLNLFIADLKSTLLGEDANVELPNSSKDILQMLAKSGEDKKSKEIDVVVENYEEIHFKGEKHLANVRQVTFGGQNAEGYFSFDDQSIVLQAAGVDRYGTECDQIYRADFSNGLPTPSTLLQRLSTGIGACTCSYFFPDGINSIHASTFASEFDSITDISKTCPTKKCVSEQSRTDPLLKKLCNTSYTWDLFPGYDIYKVNEYGNFVARLTKSMGYDAEGAVSPDGLKIVFTSMRSGDPELYLMDADGGNQIRLTNGTLGYDGGPFFSPDGTKVIFRASRPTTPEEIKKYKQLLSYNLVEPLTMELHVINVDGTGLRQITNLGASNWAPFYLSDNYRIIFSSNFNATGHFGAFDLYFIGEDGQGLQRVTYNQNGFDAFPMMSHNGRQLVWGSSRNGKSQMELNLFLADWQN